MEGSYEYSIERRISQIWNIFFFRQVELFLASQKRLCFTELMFHFT